MNRRIKKFSYLILAILLTISFFASGAGVNTVLASTIHQNYQADQLSERDALEMFYLSTNGTSWIDHTNWLETDSPCDWFGVTCEDGNVVSLNLRENNLTGSIPPEIGSLVNLNILNLMMNTLTGSIPMEIGNLTNLTELYLGSNELTGTIPPELGNLPALNILDLHVNYLTGSIPIQLGSLSNLTQLFLSLNQLSGNIPPEIGNLTNLTYLWLSSNNFSGGIPPKLGNLVNLTDLDLSSTGLSGTIPTELGNLASLLVLGLDYNGITGSIPSEFGNLTNLTNLTMSNNQLSGVIPPELGNLSNLSVMDISYNQFSDAIPAELGQLTNLSSFFINDNLLSGSVPETFTQLTQLQVFFFQNNDLCEPQSEGFQIWLYSIPYVTGTGVACPNAETATIKFLDSTGQGLAGGTVQYYDHGWKAIPGSTDVNGLMNTDIPSSKGTLTFRMKYAGGVLNKSQDISSDSIVTFETVNVTTLFLDSTGNYLDTGTVLYYAGGWQPFGTTLDGLATKELLPNTYSFRMKYGGASNDKQQDIALDSTVVFQTLNATVQLNDHTGHPLDNGTVLYYAGGWKDFGITTLGTVSKELLPNSYSFRMKYAGSSNDKSQDIALDTTVVFQTINVTVELIDHAGNPLDTGTVLYYAGGWKDFGVTASGTVSKELLPNSYSFRMKYAGSSNDKPQDAVIDPVVIFQTGLVNSVSGNCVKYYAGGWKPFIQNMELLPNEYSFRFSDGAQDKKISIIGGIENMID